MLNISGKKMLKAILKKFKNNNVTRNFHTMKERKDFFSLLLLLQSKYSFFMGDNLQEKNASVALKKYFPLCYTKQTTWRANSCISGQMSSTCFLIN